MVSSSVRVLFFTIAHCHLGEAILFKLVNCFLLTKTVDVKKSLQAGQDWGCSFKSGCLCRFVASQSPLACVFQCIN